ncbi:MAG: hypothetical protein SWZ49_33545 [Cyanobacteriota bacterium]|nr:hypothetical protein [Cyanobacteriota bacterium]
MLCHGWPRGSVLSAAAIVVGRRSEVAPSGEQRDFVKTSAIAN